jgi:ribulose-phosphate 3-epimerase
MNERKPQDILISASIMCADSLHLADEVRKLEGAGVDLLHVDIMDAHFVPNMPIGLKLIEELSSFTALRMDVHLMVSDNDFFIDRIAGHRVSRISIHLESAAHLDRELSRIRDFDIAAGVALDPATPLFRLDYVLERVDFLLLMTVSPGFAGQTIVPSAIRKIEDARRYLDDRRCSIPIQVDGNVSFEHIPRMVAAGADILVGGSSSVFVPGHTFGENVQRMRHAAAIGQDMRQQHQKSTGLVRQ